MKLIQQEAANSLKCNYNKTPLGMHAWSDLVYANECFPDKHARKNSQVQPSHKRRFLTERLEVPFSVPVFSFFLCIIRHLKRVQRIQYQLSLTLFFFFPFSANSRMLLCPVLSCPVLSCLVLSCAVLSVFLLHSFRAKSVSQSVSQSANRPASHTIRESERRLGSNRKEGRKALVRYSSRTSNTTVCPSPR